MLADRGEEVVQQPDVTALALAPAHLGVQVGQIPFQNRPVHVGELGDVHRRGGEELGEPFGCPDSPAAGLQAEPGADAPACPPFNECFSQGWGMRSNRSL